MICYAIDYDVNMTTRSLLWSGLTDPDSGELLSSTPSSDVMLPAGNVTIDGETLCFDWPSKGRLLEDWRRRTPPPTLLERFVRLRSQEALLRFAEQFGPLMPRGLYLPDVETAYGPPDTETGQHREFVRVWREVQSLFERLLTLAAHVREQESPPKEFFVRLHESHLLLPIDRPTPPDLCPRILTEWEHCSSADRLNTAWRIFDHWLRWCIRECQLRPALTIERSRMGPRIRPVFQDMRADFQGFGVSLFGALTAQLMSAAAGSGLAICSGCGNFFVPRRRRPAFGKRRYCPACGNHAALRDAAADYRRRRRDQDARPKRAAGRRRK